VTAPFSRAELLSRGAKGGVGLLASGSIAGALTGSAAAGMVPDGDLAYAPIAASEAQHLSLFMQHAGHDPIGISFPAALRIDEASDALDAFAN
jgi:hypothetical protein